MPERGNRENAATEPLLYGCYRADYPFPAPFEEAADDEKEGPVVGFGPSAIDYAYLGQGTEDLRSALVTPVISVGHVGVYQVLLAGEAVEPVDEYVEEYP